MSWVRLACLQCTPPVQPLLPLVHRAWPAAAASCRLRLASKMRLPSALHLAPAWAQASWGYVMYWGVNTWAAVALSVLVWHPW